MSDEAVRAVLDDAEERMRNAVANLRRELAGVRAGRATPAILDRVRVDYYGASVPINQVATVNIPEPRLIVISPWDKSQLPNIERAIQKADLGLSPSSDGQVIRLAIPQLTAERREALVRSVRATAESARVAIRNVRRDANDMIKELSRDGDVTEDEARHGQEEVQKLTDRFVAEVGRVLAEKEAEITEV